MIETRRTATERAFDLAASGRVASISDLRRALTGEGHSSAQITGPQMLRQLRLIIRQAKSHVEAQPSGD